MLPSPFIRIRSAIPVLLLALIASLLVACGDTDAPASEASLSAGMEAEPNNGTAAEAAGSAASDSPWPKIERQPDPEVERFVADLLSQMSLERKIGQIIQAEIKHVTAEDLREYGLGSVLNGGGSFPGGDDRAPVSEWVALSRSLHTAALEAGNGDPAIPLLWGTDAVHGHNNVFGATVFPHNVGLGATRDAELVRAIGEATAEQVSATAIDWNFAPTLAVARDLRWGRAYESFSSDPDVVTELGRAAVIGLQGEPGDAWLAPPHVLATAKHFVGDGGTFEGVDQGDARMSEAQLADIHGRPYPAAIEAGVQTVMASFSSWNGQKMHGHRYLLTEVLKERMGFDGFVIGDWNGHGQVPGCTVTDCLEALEAGVDMFMVPEDWKAFHETLLEHARNGTLPRERLDDAVRRILRVKKRAGLFDRPVPEGGDGLPGAEGHRALARRAVRQSLVLLKNNGRVLPIDPGAKILVVGDGADDIGKQSGGWTLDWQGRKGANDDFPNGQSVFAGLAEQVEAAGGEIRLGTAGADGFEPDVIVAVYGEDPYAEGQGDVDTLEFQPGTREALDLLDALSSYEAPIVSVFLSGRPMWVNPEMNRSAAFVAAWLPGTEGGGVADVLLADADGAVRHDFTGQLSFAWPAEPTPGEDGGFSSLFELGYGLSYEDSESIEVLPEAAMAPPLTDLIPESGDWTLFDGSASTPWRLVVQGHNNSADPAVELTDRRIQGDARHIIWTQGVPGFVALVARPSVSLRGFADDRAVLAFDLRAASAPPDDLVARIDCAKDCAGAEVALAPLLAGVGREQWQTLRIDLSCFVNENGMLDDVSAIHLLATEQAAELSIAEVRLEREAGGPVSLACEG